MEEDRKENNKEKEVTMLSQHKRDERMAQDLEQIKQNNAGERETERYLCKLVDASEHKRSPKRKIIPWGLFCPECDSKLVEIKHYSKYSYALQRYHHLRCPNCTYEVVEHKDYGGPCL